MNIQSATLEKIFLGVVVRAECAPTKDKVKAIQTVKGKLLDESALNSKAKQNALQKFKLQCADFETDAVQHLSTEVRAALVNALRSQVMR